MTRALAIALFVLAACGDDSTEAGAPAEPFDSGDDRVLILNGKLSDPSQNYALNRQEAGRWIGNELYLYDPGQPGAMLRLGRLDYGPDNAEFAFDQMQVREIAASPVHGVWGIFDDVTRDEWLLGKITVPSWQAEDQRLAVELFAFAETDTPAYGASDVMGLGFRGDTLLFGTPADGFTPGSLFSFPAPFPPARDEADPVYIAGDLSEPLFDLTGNLGVAGDVETLGDTAYALLNSGNATGRIQLAALGDVATPIGAATELPADDPIDALAAVNGTFFGVSREGVVYRIDVSSGAIRRFDDLGPLLPPDDRGQSTRRLRGGAPVTLP